jgi:hypothetical protein
MPASKTALLEKDNLRLRAEVAGLKLALAELREEMAFHRRHDRSMNAKEGENYLRDLLGGELSVHNAGHDLVVGGMKFEVKTSDCASVDHKKTLSTMRWTWHRILGNSGRKGFDRLLLLGKADPRYLDRYRDADSPYVIFDVPVRAVPDLLSNTTPAFIQVSTNPDRQRTPKGQLLWSLQITRAELKKKYAGRTAVKRRK